MGYQDIVERVEKIEHRMYEPVAEDAPPDPIVERVDMLEALVDDLIKRVEALETNARRMPGRQGRVGTDGNTSG